MATTFEQEPLFDLEPATFPWIYILRNDAIVTGVPTPYWNVKFVGGVFVNQDFASLPAASSQVCTIKTIPNQAGVGVFNIQRFAEAYTGPQYEAYKYQSAFRPVTHKGNVANLIYYFPIHIIDKYSQNENCMKYIAFNVNLEGAAAANLPAQTIPSTTATGSAMFVWNGYLRNDFVLRRTGVDFGYDYKTFYAPLGGGYYGILSDAPMIQYANDGDYGVISFFNQIFDSLSPQVTSIQITGHFVGGTTANFYVDNIDANGGTTTTNSGAAYGWESILFFGVFPGNLKQWNSTFAGWLNLGMTHYTFQLVEKAGGGKKDTPLSRLHTIVVNCPQGRKYEPVRITWLNSLGGWDYYTFNMKSSETIKTKRNDWTELEGSWNRDQWNPYGWKGGKKAYTVNGKKKIKVNTDFVDDEVSDWFEILINSPEIYILKPWEDFRSEDDGKDWIFKRYITPVRLLTSSYKKKTRKNDSIIQYSFEFEESITLNTQPI